MMKELLCLLGVCEGDSDGHLEERGRGEKFRRGLWSNEGITIADRGDDYRVRSLNGVCNAELLYFRRCSAAVSELTEPR